jgi:hypothetical protein
LLGMKDAAGEVVCAGPCDMQLAVRIKAHGIPPEQLRDLVEESQRLSPMPTALRNAVPVGLRIEPEVK